MKRAAKLFASLAILLSVGLFVSCSSTKVEGNNQEHLVMAPLWLQNAAEYRALCYQAFNLASEKIESIAGKKNKEGRPQAVIVDVDETILNNGPFSAAMILKNKSYGPEEWNKWVEQSSAEPIPGSVEFLQLVDKNKMEIFYVSNRMENSLGPTYKNLVAVGFPVKKENMMFRAAGTSDSKMERRKLILDKYEVVMLVGDSMMDFTEAFEMKGVDASWELADKIRSDFGNKYVVIPNPIYGPWESMIYNFEHGKKTEDKIEDRYNHLYPMTE